ncbi:MAG: DUF6807 family protein, partial [Verrucomicrobiota bacterium]
YRKNYHTPADDWGTCGGILRCDPDGSNLEVVSRGYRNPWDICFDDGFDWLGTDNDQTFGDKIFAPFFGAHFGWGHPWSYDWKGDDHWPSAPSAGPLFEGSGAGVIYCGLADYPERYRNVFLINDWLQRKVYIYRPQWNGAWMKPDREELELLAHAAGGRSMGQSQGRRFDPVDIEIGPDGAIWISSWGRQYGAHYEKGQLANEGRIYRIWPKAAPPGNWAAERDPLQDLGHHLPAWRTDAQEALLAGRGPEDLAPRLEAMFTNPPSKAHQTWALWTRARMGLEDEATETLLATLVRESTDLNLRIQALRAMAHRAERRGGIIGTGRPFEALQDKQARLRHEAVQALHRTKEKRWTSHLLDLAGRETDRHVFYSTWQALRSLMSADELKESLEDPRDGVRRAALLALLEDDRMSETELGRMSGDVDSVVAGLAKKRLGGKAHFEHRGRPIEVYGEKRTPAAMVNPFGRVRSSTGRPYKAAVLQAAEAVYTDRPYRIRKVPEELSGRTFLQTANDDADDSSGISVSVELKYPSTVYLADDSRGEALPVWARDGWTPTDLILETDDPKSMRLYRRDVSAGTMVLGSNRDGVKARKGNYILVAVPKLFTPLEKLTTVDEVLKHLDRGDPERGRDLFFSPDATGCFHCHRMEGVGQVFAPDLAGIGQRAEPAFLARSILEPSADITEGFALQQLHTGSGNIHGGIIIEETGRALKLGMAGGESVTVEKADLVKRESIHVSPMPPFHGLLTPLQVADLIAWLNREPTPEPPPDEQSMEITVDGVRIATYLFKHPQLTRPAFVNVRTRSGIPVTRTWPAPASEDHRWYHPGLWMSFGWLSGNDYWRLQSRVVSEGLMEELKTEPGKTRFAVRDRYLDTSGEETICIQETRYTFEKVKEGIRLDWDATFYNDERGIVFGDQEESGLALRMARNLTVQFGNGRIVNDRGEENGGGTWGKPFQWIDYAGSVAGRPAGIMIMPYPYNPRESWAHSRDYGALVANPFPKQPQERRQPYVQTLVAKGQRFRLRYTVLIHEGDF